MNREQKVDFLKRLFAGKTTIKELTEVDEFDITIPTLTWIEVDPGIYSNMCGDYFDANNIKNGELRLTRAEVRQYMKKVRLRALYLTYFEQPEDDNYISIVIK